MPSSLPPNVAALTGLIIWYGVFTLLDRKDRPHWRRPLFGKGGTLYKSSMQYRWWRPLLPLLLGAISFRLLGTYLTSVHPLLSPHLESLTAGSHLLRFILDVGLREEIIKLLFALPFLLFLTSRQARTFAHLAAALVGVGFATAENRMFFTAHSEPTLLVGRVFSTTLLHAAATGLCGTALLRAIQGGGQAWARCAATLLIVATAHGLYDWAPASGHSWLHLGGTSWLSQALVITLIAIFLSQYRHQQPVGARGAAAMQWLLIGALLQYTLALGLTQFSHGTTAAAWICARECALFLPVIAFTALFLATFTQRTSKTAEPQTAEPHSA